MSAKFCKEHNRYHHVDEPCPYCEIRDLQAIVDRVTEVRDSLATQTLNSHAVKQLDKALIKGENNASTTD